LAIPAETCYSCAAVQRKREAMKIRGHWRRILAVLIPLAVGLFVATGTGSARRGHEAGPPLTPKPGVEVKHDTSPPLRTIPPKPGQGRKQHLERKIPVPLGSGTPDPVVQTSAPA